jgi:XTP/dITP diphosphohydrolase
VSAASDAHAPLAMRLVLATNNPHKRREFAALLAPHQIDLMPASLVLPPETGTTFAENAIVKARAAGQATGGSAIADDSGIEAEALGGAPGVYSARYAGPAASDAENLDKLLREAPAGSALTYVCALAYVDPGGIERIFEGRCMGKLDDRPRGDGGFGYDPAFVPGDGPPGLTMAELTPEQKHAISHRGRAARQLLAWLES